jgi:hypothetical protein
MILRRTGSTSLSDDRDAGLREAIRRRVERHRAERLRELQDALARPWSGEALHGSVRSGARFGDRA